MHCPGCGLNNPSQALYCMSCGSSLAAPAPPGPPPTSNPDNDPSFVGRQRELGMLAAALQDALAGHGRVVMLVGEPGIGKTRLAQEFEYQSRSCQDRRQSHVRWRDSAATG